MKIMLINGVNLNFLGIREKHIYGDLSYESICDNLMQYAKEKKIELNILQSNHEGEIVDFLQSAYKEKYDAVIINPGAFTHYSIAIFDAIKSLDVPCIEVHLSNIQNREEFRKHSIIAPACVGQISGFGVNSYYMAIDAAMKL